MSNFVVDSPKSKLDDIHALYKTITGKDTVRGGQNTVRNPKPFIVYDLIAEFKYKRHQIMKEYDDYLGKITPTYKQPHKYKFQYTLVFDSTDKSCAAMIQNLSRYLVSDRFKLAMDKLSVSFYMPSDITEVPVPIEGFTDRQFIFQMDYFWVDIWSDTDNDATSGKIETVQIAETTPPVGA